jgi:hypothetical protein
MTVILDNGIVFHEGFGVDDAVSAHPRSGIDQRMVHDDHRCGQLGLFRRGESCIRSFDRANTRFAPTIA